MPSPTATIAKLNTLLKRVGACDREVYKRQVTRSGGDSLTGEGVQTSGVDSKLDPQPAVTRPDERTAMMLYGTTVIPITDYSLLVSPSAITKEELADKDTLIVFKEPQLGTLPEEEECFVVDYVPTVLGGEVVALNVLVRSKAR